jgi:hypothetical protein
MEFGRQGANATAEEIDGLLRMERFAGQGVGAESPNQGPTALAPSPLSPQYSTHYLADTGWIHLTLVDGRWTKRQVTDLCVLGGLPRLGLLIRRFRVRAVDTPSLLALHPSQKSVTIAT